MIARIFFALLMLAFVPPALAQQWFSSAPPGGNGSSVTATGSTTARTAADRAADVFNVMDYGAACDGTTEDSAAINAAFAAARAVAHPKLNQTARIASPPNRTCLFSSTINATGLTFMGISVEGGVLDCAVTGGICIDALGSRFIRWSINLYGDVANTPSIGIQIGTIGAGCGGHNFDQAAFTGYFTFSALYNSACETTSYNGTQSHNRYTGGSGPGYAGVFDGYNHFNATSAFVTNTTPVDSRQSFSLNTFLGGAWENASASSVIWVGGSYLFSMTNTYTGSDNGTGGVITSWCLDQACNRNMTLRIHTEQRNTPYGILQSGTNANPILAGLIYTDDQALYTTASFHADTGIDSVSMPNAQIQVNSYFINPSALIWDQPSLWLASGHIDLPSMANWTEPTRMAGTVCIANQGTCTEYVPTGALNRNPDFVLDQPHAGSPRTTTTGNLVADGWRFNGGLSTGGTLSMQFAQATAAPTGFTNSLTAKVLVGATAGASQSARFESMIEGSEIARLGLGSSTAPPFMVNFCAQSTVTGQYSAYVQNGARSRSYVIPFTIAAANTWQCYVNQIPGETSGTWLMTPNVAGMFVGFTIGAGSNFNTPGTGWQSSTYYNSSTDANFSGTANNQLWVAAVHIIPSAFNLPYSARRLSDELVLAKHFYRKSLNYNVLPTAPQGLLGADTVVLPYSFSSGLTAAMREVFDPPMFNNNGSTPPTITFLSPSISGAACYNTTLAATSGAASAVNVGDNGFTISCALVSGDTAGNNVAVQWQADSGF